MAMELTAVWQGLLQAITVTNLFWCLMGVALGTLVGVLPGIGVMTALSLLLPVTYHMEPAGAIIMLAGVYYGTSYGCSITAILLRIPGTPASTVTCIDGYAMTQQGRGGVALSAAAISSFVGALIGIMVLIMLMPLVQQFAYDFGPAEYFSVMLLALVSASVINDRAMMANASMIVLGIWLGLVGTDPNTGASRLDFGLAYLMDGINLAVLAMGLFGVSEVMHRMHQQRQLTRLPILGSIWPTCADLKASLGSVLRGSAIGSFFGTLPGTGPVTASFVAYTAERNVKTGHDVGKGAIQGVVAPESANNAAAQTAFIPTLGLGVPGDAGMALILSALIIQGITPGPLLISGEPVLFWSLVASFVIGNVFLLLLNIPLIRLWVRIVDIPEWILSPLILILIAIGAYSINSSVADIVMVTAFGVLGWWLRHQGFDLTPLILGFVLGPDIEENLRKSLTITGGDFGIFLRPISMTFLMLALLIIVITTWKRRT